MILKGKVALVTGAAGGIGRAAAVELSKHGAILGIADLNAEGIEFVASELEGLGGQSIALVGDVSNKNTMDLWVSQVVETFGSLDVMVNNAGISHIKPLLDMDPDEWDRVFAINTRSVLLGIQAAARIMKSQEGGGRIINTASVAGRGGRPLLAAYAASKAAVINLTQSAAQALAEFKITCNSICPGVVSTAMGRMALAEMKQYVESGAVPASQSQVPPAPLGPEASAEDVARMISYLAGPGGAYITGQAINIDGGRCMN